ncbi:hypothetical protein [Trinickia sp.]|uniref:hypothetical protein n=1 Tax=Trinickia sp. TaxID=2571163 RepID=UPI003F7FF654
MRDQTARDPRFPTACARCGGRISEPVTFCPHCGAHARFALAGAAPHAAHAAQPPRGPAASARAEPKAPAYDFEGDLDPPWPAPPTPLFASPDGDPYGEVHAPGFRGERQWGLKAGTVLVVVAFVVLYGGAVAVHRFDGASPLSPPSTSKSVDGAIASNGAGGSNLAATSDGNASSNGSGSGSNALQPPAQADHAAPVNGSPSNSSPSVGVAGNSPVSNGTVPAQALSQASAPAPAPAPAPNADASRTPGTSVASLQPPSAATQAQPQTAPQSLPQAEPRSQSNSAQDALATGRERSHAQSFEARGSAGDTAAAGSQSARQANRSQSQREGAQYGRVAAARALDSAQAQLAKSDLRGARTSVARALAADPSNGQALSLREQLMSREQERDASLSAAHACVVQSRWNCVWHNAGKALSVDASSTEAKALVDRAIVESGAATTPAGPGPDNVQVPMVQ